MGWRGHRSAGSSQSPQRLWAGPGNGQKGERKAREAHDGRSAHRLAGGENSTRGWWWSATAGSPSQTASQTTSPSPPKPPSCSPAAQVRDSPWRTGDASSRQRRHGRLRHGQRHALLPLRSAGYVAFLNVFGSMFLQALLKALEGEERHLALNRLMTRINWEVAFHCQARGTYQGCKEMPCFVTNLLQEVFPFSAPIAEGADGV